MENEEKMEASWSREVKKFLSYGGLVITAVAWLDTRYMGANEKVITTMENHHQEYLALDKNVTRIEKDVEYIKIDLDKILSDNNKKDGTRNEPSRSSRTTASLFAVPPKDEHEQDKKQYLSSL
jgi:hypothetical protein